MRTVIDYLKKFLLEVIIEGIYGKTISYIVMAYIAITGFIIVYLIFQGVKLCFEKFVF